MGGTEIGEDKTQVIVDGYIFLVDRSVPKIIQELGQANEVIVTSKVTQNGDWQNPVATVTGTIIKYGGGTVTNVTATATNGVTITGLPTTGGNFTIPNIATDTIITITTTDSAGKTKTHTIEVKLIRDETPPVITTAEAKANRMKIAIKAVAEDKESGITSLRYSITPTTGLPSGQNEGDLPQNGTSIEITSTAIETYTVTITATNGAGNTVTKEITGVRTTDAMSVEEVKNTVNADNIKEYLGTKVDYNPTAGGTWRIFYQDNEDGEDENGYFGCGKGTIFLKRDYESSKTMKLTLSSKTSNTDPAVVMMRKMNPKWAKSSYSTIDLNNEKACVWLHDDTVWKDYRTSNSSRAIGSPSVEMYMKSFNLWKSGDVNANNLVCKIGSEKGYAVGTYGTYTTAGGYGTEHILEGGPGKVFVSADNPDRWWFSSPSSNSGVISGNCYQFFIGSAGYANDFAVYPVVPLDL